MPHRHEWNKDRGRCLYCFVDVYETLAAKDAEIATLQGVIDRVRAHCVKVENDAKAWFLVEHANPINISYHSGAEATAGAILALLPPTGGES